MMALCVSMRVMPIAASLRSFIDIFGTCGMTKLIKICDQRLEDDGETTTGRNKGSD